MAAANAAGIPIEVLHRVASMASGGMDTLPHNGAVITLLAVTGLTHRQAYKRHLRDHADQDGGGVLRHSGLLHDRTGLTAYAVTKRQ